MTDEEREELRQIEHDMRMERRMEQLAELAEQRATRLATLKIETGYSDIISVNAAYGWDPRFDDPSASSDDLDRPDEAAIRDPKASYEEKASAWTERAERLNREGHIDGSHVAISHAEYHDEATRDTPRERREREAAEADGKQY